MSKKGRYLGNPEFDHLHIDDNVEGQKGKETACKDHDTPEESLFYQVEGEASNVGWDRAVEDRNVGSEEEEDSPAGTSRGASSSRRSGEAHKSLQHGKRKQGSRDRSPFGSHLSLTPILAPPRELKVKLTKNLSTRINSVRRFVDFTICNSDVRQPMFKIVKDEQDVYRLRNGDFLLRVRLTFNTKRNKDDPYVKDYLAEIKFRGRLFKYNEDKESFEELCVVTQCMAICLVASSWRSPINPLLTSS